GTVEVDYQLAINGIPVNPIEEKPLSVPSHDSTAGAALRFPLVDHGAARSESIAGVNSAMERQLVDTKEKSASFAKVFHSEAEHRQKNQHRINHYPRVPVRTSIRC